MIHKIRLRAVMKELKHKHKNKDRFMSIYDYYRWLFLY